MAALEALSPTEKGTAVTHGCGLPQLARTGGAGLMYCFAAD